MNEQADFLYGKASRTLIIITVVVMLIIVAGIVLLPFYAGLPPDAEGEAETDEGQPAGPIPPPTGPPADVPSPPSPP